MLRIGPNVHDGNLDPKIGSTLPMLAEGGGDDGRKALDGNLS